MNNLLPNIKELKPIIDSNSTFYDCGFNNEFDLLTEEQKLQIICDIVRQTIFPTPFPNPEMDLRDLKGNCTTASLIAKEYLEKSNLCKNIKFVMARKRKFDPDDIVSIHTMLLIEGNDGCIYQFDSTPFVGYKFGKVENINNRFYEEYTEVTDEMRYFLDMFKEIIYLNSINKIDLNKIDFYVNICLESLQYKSLNAYCGNALKCLMKYIIDVDKKSKIECLVKRLRPYSKTNIPKKEYQKELLKKQVSIWEEELEDLKTSNKNLKRQLELSQNIIQELKMLYPEYERERVINDRKMKLSFINPRVLYEYGLNTIMIKTSAYYLGCEDIIKSTFTNQYHSTGEYSVNLSLKTEQTGIKPLLFSHPLGETCIRSLSGKSTVLLIEADPKTILNQKRELRENFCKDMWNKEVIWLDGEPIIWDPFVTNLIHGTDNASEAALHYLIAYPEHQNMTRFMYPNPKLEYNKVKCRK